MLFSILQLALHFFVQVQQTIIFLLLFLQDAFEGLLHVIQLFQLACELLLQAVELFFLLGECFAQLCEVHVFLLSFCPSLLQFVIIHLVLVLQVVHHTLALGEQLFLHVLTLLHFALLSRQCLHLVHVLFLVSMGHSEFSFGDGEFGSVCANDLLKMFLLVNE